MTAYISVQDASAWLAAHLTSYSAWTDNPSKQAVALEEASDHIDALPLKGVRYGSQDREFPRFDPALYQANPDALYLTAYDPSAVPQEVKDACCLEALAILEINLTSDRLERLKLQQQGVVSMDYGGTLESYTPGADRRYNGLLSKQAYDLLRFWIAGAVEAV